MTVHAAESQPEAELSIQVTRADGTIVPIGRTAVTTRSPIKRAWWNHVGQRLSERRIRAANRDAARRAASTQED